MNDEYLILLDEAEIPTFTAQYGIDRYLPGFSIIGLRGWDDFIIADRPGLRFTVPTVPLLEGHLQPFEFPADVASLRSDARFTGKIKWYIQPVVFGGDPSPGGNLTWVNHEQHAQLVQWWNEKYKSVASGAMTRFMSIIASVLVVMTALSNTLAADSEPPSLKCEIGPLTKSFGRSNWLVYACDDGHSLVVVSDQGNPAMPFYFTFTWKDGAYQLHGEGTGDKKATQAAFDELSKLDQPSIENLVREVTNHRNTP